MRTMIHRINSRGPVLLLKKAVFQACAAVFFLLIARFTYALSFDSDQSIQLVSSPCGMDFAQSGITLSTDRGVLFQYSSSGYRHAATLQSGKAYIFAGRDDFQSLISCDPYELVYDEKSVEYEQGWNLVGNPYHQGVPFEKAFGEYLDVIGNDIYTLAGDRFEVVDASFEMQPYQGYWVYFDEAVNITFPASYEMFPCDGDISCIQDADCDDGDALTRDTCTNPGTCLAACSTSKCTPACSSHTDCGYQNATTANICVHQDTCDAYCTDAPIVTEVSSGDDHTCVLQSSGTVKCWGEGLYKQTWEDPASDGNKFTAEIPGLTSVVSLSSNDSDICAVIADGTIKCWNWSRTWCMSQNPSCQIRTIPGITSAVSVELGSNHSCAIINDGSLKCWGYNFYGQLGNGATIDSSTPVTVSGVDSAVSVSIGWEHTCASLSNGQVKCWGNNHTGQLGNGTTINSLAPVPVPGIDSAVSVSSSSYSTCALLAEGGIKCWGSNESGQFGNGSAHDSYVPVPVSGIQSAVSLDIVRYNGCAVLADGEVKCWGSNHCGQLGDGTGLNSLTPVTAMDIVDAVSVSLGAIRACALTSDGTVKCWGHHKYGNSVPVDRSTSPVVIHFF